MARNIEIEAAIRGGKTQGAVNVASGHWARVQALGSQIGDGNRHTIGQDNVRSGHAEQIAHKRWHVNLGQEPKTYCSFCPPELTKRFRRPDGG